MRNEIKVGELHNGMLFCSQYDWSGGTNLAGIGVAAGAIHAPPGCVGLPHWVEHLLAREALKYASLEAELIFEKFLGDPDGDINIRIDRISTFYGFGDLLKRKSMLACLDVMAHFLRDRIITKTGGEIEKAAVHNEYYLRGVDSVPSLVDDLMHQTVYTSNPARLRIDCEVDDLKKMTTQQARRFISKHYVPGNMFLIAFGPKFEEVKELAKRYFDDWKERPVPQLKYDHSDDFPVFKAIRSTEIIRAGIGQYHFGLGFPTENYFSKDSETMDVLARILAFRLRLRLRDGNRDFDKGVYRANAYISRSAIHGLLYATFATVSEEFAKTGEHAILEEIRKLKEELVSDSEFDAMTFFLNNEHEESFRKAALNLSEMVIEAISCGDRDLSHFHSHRDKLRKVTRRKLRDTANKYFTEDYARVLIKPV